VKVCTGNEGRDFAYSETLGIGDVLGDLAMDILGGVFFGIGKLLKLRIKKNKKYKIKNHR